MQRVCIRGRVCLRYVYGVRSPRVRSAVMRWCCVWPSAASGASVKRRPEKSCADGNGLTATHANGCCRRSHKRFRSTGWSVSTVLDAVGGRREVWTTTTTVFVWSCFDPVTRFDFRNLHKIGVNIIFVYLSRRRNIFTSNYNHSENAVTMTSRLSAEPRRVIRLFTANIQDRVRSAYTYRV